MMKAMEISESGAVSQSTIISVEKDDDVQSSTVATNRLEGRASDSSKAPGPSGSNPVAAFITSLPNFRTRHLVAMRQPATIEEAKIAAAKFATVTRIRESLTRRGSKRPAKSIVATPVVTFNPDKLLDSIRVAVGEENVPAEPPSSCYREHDWQERVKLSIGTQFRYVLTDLMVHSFGDAIEADVKYKQIKQKEVEAWDEWRQCQLPISCGWEFADTYPFPNTKKVWVGNLGFLAYPSKKMRDWDMNARKYGIRIIDRCLYF